MRRILGAATIFIGLWHAGLAFGQGSELDKAVGELADRLAFNRKGDVVGVEGDTIYISLGWQEGVLEGTKFEVVRLGEFLRTGDRKETLIAEVEVVRAREKTSLAKVTQRKEAIKEGDRAYELRKKITRIAVTEFPFRDKFNALTRNVQDIVYTHLIQKGLTVVEREKLEEILREQKKGTTGVIDLATAAQMGKLLGVEAVVVGSISDLGNSLAMLGRLVDVEKGVALSAARIELAKTPVLADLVKTDVRATRLALVEAPVGTRASEEPPSAAGAGQVRKISFENKFFEDHDIFFALEGCEILEDRKMECKFTFKNKTKHIIGVFFFKDINRSYILDNLLNKTPLLKSEPISLDQEQPIPPEVEIKGVMIWNKLNERASNITITIAVGGGAHRSILFPNISLASP